MKKLIYILLVLFWIVVALASCLHKDSKEVQTVVTGEKQIKTHFAKFINKKNITINGTDFLQSQMPVGEFGGTFFTSTIGEGPQTFNPFNTKDSTSATIAEMLFDGLTTIDANNGEVIPKLAKSFEITDFGKKYIVHLRHGIVWSDGKPITADDVYYTWNTII